MDTGELSNTLLSIWRDQPKAIESIKQEIDLEIQKQLLMLFSVGDFYYFVFNVLSGAFDFMSSEVEKVTGYPPSVLSVEKLVESIHPDDRAFVRNCENTVLSFFQNISPEKFFNYKVMYDYRIKKSNGEYIRIMHQSITINYGPEGTILHTFCIHTNITHIKRETHPHLSFIGLNGEKSFIDYPIENYKHPKHPTIFSAREQEILVHLWEGLDSTEIAKRLFISKNTVDTHRRSMLSKSGTKNVVELLRFALKNGEL